jgi:hypothetical protein
VRSSCSRSNDEIGVCISLAIVFGMVIGAIVATLSVTGVNIWFKWCD